VPPFTCPHCGQRRDSLTGGHIGPDGIGEVRCPAPGRDDAEERAAIINHLFEHCLAQPGDCAGMTSLRGLLNQAVTLLQT
jgi:hypothetical protein